MAANTEAEHPNHQLVNKFYSAFQSHDGKTMADCYARDATFSDPVYRTLNGYQAGCMWEMFCSGAAKSKLEVTFNIISVDDNSGKVHWEARYLFQGNRVHNIIEASFKFKDGKIIEHCDIFNFHRWARQALGIKGKLFGWTSGLHNKVSSLGMSRLQKYIEKKRKLE